ncbi:MAG: hypothetical protein RLZZ184_1553 [Cyanobacteriota bacterium]|jgi:hypothetical protein
MTLKQFALKTDYAVLIQQKQTLLNLLDRDLLNAVQDQDLLGLINFLDAFQDAVVDSGVLPEDKVFPV